MVLKTVAVLRGGPDPEYEVSLKTGARVLHELATSLGVRYSSRDVFIDRSGVWHVRGTPVSPERALSGVDVVWNALHGLYGEGGAVQRILDRIGIPYTGSRAYPSLVAMHKPFAKEALRQLPIRMPHSITLGVSDRLREESIKAFRTFVLPIVIKPASTGSSVGVTIARTFFEFEEGIKRAFNFSARVLIEEYITGREATVGVVDEFRGKSLYVFPVVEIVPPHTSRFFDYDAKYGAETLERCPGNFSRTESQELQTVAEQVHRELGLRHYSRSDFIVSPRGIYFLEANTLPGLTESSLFPKSLAATGSTTAEFIDHILNLAVRPG